MSAAAHDPAIPPRDQRFEPVQDHRGPRLALVFGNQAPDGVCPYAAADRCHHCDIGLGEGQRLDDAENLRRLRWFQQHYRPVWPGLAHLVLYNSGSTLNPIELGPEVVAAALGFARGLPRLTTVSMDSREAYMQRDRVRSCSALLGRGRSLRIILGIESADDEIRDGLLQKRMPRAAIERAVAEIGAVRATLRAEPAADLAAPGLSVNVVVGGPGTTAAGAAADAVATARYALDLAAVHELDLDLNLHPYYPSQRGRLRFPEHPRASPQLTMEALQAVDRAVSDQATIFVGWQDEGHDQEPGLRTAELRGIVEGFDRFNRGLR